MRNINIVLFLLLPVWLWGQSPKYEYRATWLATVWRIDWPTSAIDPNDSRQIGIQKQRMERMLDSLASGNMNAVYFQVRGFCDAMYESSYEPWSSYLTGERGRNPGFDPLAFVVEAGHHRGLEVYAWINPFRYETQAGSWNNTPLNYAESHPEWLLTTSKGCYLNPAIPEVRQRNIDVIREIITKYDIDGIVFDDYFYPGGMEDQDKEQQILYKPANQSVEDWRRENINTMVRQVYELIQTTKSGLKFGIGPAGIWGGDSKSCEKYRVKNPEGISLGYAFNGIYCDPLAWLNDGTIDFISPQIYWTIGSGNTDYQRICEWWYNVAHQFKRYCFVSHTISDMSPNPVSLQKVVVENEQIELDALSNIERSGILRKINYRSTSSYPRNTMAEFGYNEICNQIRFSRAYDRTKAGSGSVFYSTNKYVYSTGCGQYFCQQVFNNRSLIPPVFWKEYPNYDILENIRVDGDKLIWPSVEGCLRYVVYAVSRQEWNQAAVQGNPRYIQKVVYGTEFKFPKGLGPTTHRFAVASLDCYGNESAAGMPDPDLFSLQSPVLTSPVNNESLTNLSSLSWMAVSGADLYIIEISKDPSFNRLEGKQETVDNQISLNQFYDFELDVTYYWRVRSRKVGCKDAVSEIRSFQASDFKILSPEDKSSELPLTPTFRWADVGNNSQYRLEIAKTADSFENLSYSAVTSQISHQVTANYLFPNNTYYARVVVLNGQKESVSEPIEFSTITVIPDIPQIIKPTESSSIYGDEVLITWEEESAATGFRIEVCQNKTFPIRVVKAKEVMAQTYEIGYNGLKEGVWYVRIFSKYGNKKTDPSEIRSFVILPAQKTENLKDLKLLFMIYDGVVPKLILNRKDISPIRIDIFNMNGICVRTWESIDTMLGRREIVLAGLPKNGTYLAIVRIGNKQSILKFVL